MAAETYTFRVEGMHCGSCGALIDDVVQDLDGVIRARTDVPTGTSTVQADPARCRPEQVVAAIAEAGYQARLAD